MNSPVFNPMNDIKANESRLVKIKSFGSPKEGQWGPYYPDCMVEVNGSTENWNLNGKKKEEIEKLGFKEGDTVLIERWYRDGKGGYNFKSPDQKNPYSQPTSPEPKDDIQERIIKGMCFNNACTLLTGLAKTNEFKTEEAVEALSKELYVKMKQWLIS